MKSFVILFRQGPRSLSEADLARRQQDVSAWAREQNSAGHTLEPRILTADHVRAGAGTEHGHGVGEAAWPITALLFLEAHDLEEAGRIAASHPALQYGASVEVRAWNSPVVVQPAGAR